MAFRIWYQFCLLSLLQPFVTGSASLVDGLPHSLSGDATPGAVCRQASEAIVTLTSIYQTRHCLTYLPPLLPYMVFAAALHQLSLVNGPACPAEEQQQQEERVESPYALSPRSGLDSTDSQRETRSSPPISGRPRRTRGPTAGAPEPASHASASQTQKIAAERPSSLATASTCLPHDSQARWPRVCSFLSSATSDRDELCSSDTASDMLPSFTSRPTDLVTIGSLQLASMGLQHPGAAEAANLLRGVVSASGAQGPKLNEALCMELNTASRPLAGPGLQRGYAQQHGSPEAMSCEAATPSAVPRVEGGAFARPLVQPSKTSSFDSRPPQLLFVE